MKLTKLALIGLLAVPSAAFAEGETVEVTDQQLDTFRVAIADIGCTISTEESALAVETATNYDEDTLAAIVAQLRVYNEIVDASEDGGITLVSGDCAT